jgi:hypothetical protein
MLFSQRQGWKSTTVQIALLCRKQQMNEEATQQMNKAKQQMNDARLASGSAVEGRDDFYKKLKRIQSPVAMN